MTLKNISLGALLIALPLLAENQSNQEMADFLDSAAEQSADAIGIIEYRVVLYKDRTDAGHDAQTWQTVVQKTTQSLRIVEDGDRWADAVADMFKVARAASGAGIHGEISVSMSDGNKSGCCGEKCNCAEQYKGNCPCSLRDEPCAGCDADDDDLDDESEIIWPDGDELFFEDEEEQEESEEFGSGGSCHINTRITCCGRK